MTPPNDDPKPQWQKLLSTELTGPKMPKWYEPRGCLILSSLIGFFIILISVVVMLSSPEKSQRKSQSSAQARKPSPTAKRDEVNNYMASNTSVPPEIVEQNRQKEAASQQAKTEKVRIEEERMARQADEGARQKIDEVCKILSEVRFLYGKEETTAWKKINAVIQEYGIIDCKSDTPIYTHAIFSARFDTMKILIDEGLDVRNGQMLFDVLGAGTYASEPKQRNLTRIVKLLLENGANPEALTGKSKHRGGPILGLATPVNAAAFLGEFENVKVLVEAGVDVNVKDEHKWTPLHWAVVSCHPAMVEYLLEHGANPNAVTDNGDRPLDRTSSCKNEETKIHTILVKHGAKHSWYEPELE